MEIRFRQVLLTIFVYLFSTLVWFLPAEEELLFSQYQFAVEMGEWGPYKALTPTQKFAIWLRRLGGAMWVSNYLFGVVYFDLGDGESVHD